MSLTTRILGYDVYFKSIVRKSTSTTHQYVLHFRPLIHIALTSISK